MLIPQYTWKRKIGEPLSSPGKCKVTGNEGGLPNIDDGYYQGIPLGGFGAGTFSQSYRGDFSTWQHIIGKHIYETAYSCQFGIHENGEAFILNDKKPENGSLSSWNFKKQNGMYHALYPIAYFEYTDLNIIQEQFSPIIPHNYQETSFPVAVFKWHISNKKNTERTLSLLWTWKSPFGSKDNFVYQENIFSGIVFDNLNSPEKSTMGQLGMFIQKEDTEVSYLCSFNESGDGKEVWRPFSKSGTLFGSEPLTEEKEKSINSPAALCTKVTIAPGDTKTITFIVVWDFPIFETASSTKWYKQYTKSFGKDGRNITRIARKTFGENEKWLLEIKKWHSSFLKLDKPDWLKTLLINEVYYLASGGTIWTSSKVPEKEIEKQVLKQEEHFGVLECFDYPFYETLDVRFYGSFPLISLWPNLEKMVLKDYIKWINKEILEEKFFDHPLDKSKGKRKIKGACPHDLGSMLEDPFLISNSYPHVNVNKWKDLNSKFILQIYRYFLFTGKKDLDFLKSSWDSLESSVNYLKSFDKDNDYLIEHENIPDWTYDNWSLNGPGTYCNGLFLSAIKAIIEIGKILNKDSKKYEEWFNLGKKNLNEKLWNGEYFLLDTNKENNKIILADSLCGQWYADLLNLGDIFEKDKTEKMLKKIYETNFLKVLDGKVGPINGINSDGTFLPESKIWKQNTQWNEVWIGVALSFASHLEKRGLKDEALKVAFSIYSTIYETKGYWFRTPEAWDINGDFRASMYHRPGAIWAFLC